MNEKNTEAPITIDQKKFPDERSSQKKSIATSLISTPNVGESSSTSASTEKRIDTNAQILISPQPVKIDIDTPTDWPAVIAPFVLGAAAFYFTSANQIQQIRSSTANYRNEWLKEIRATAIDFTSAAFDYFYRHTNEDNFRENNHAEARALITRMVKAQATMVLMLDAKHA